MIARLFAALFLDNTFCLFSATSTSPRWNTVGVTVAGISGQFGAANNQLNTPAKIAIDLSDSLYIADFNNQRVQKYLLNATTGTTVAGNETAGNTSTQLNYPTDVAVDSNYNIYVADTNNQRIQLWNAGASVGLMVAGLGKLFIQCYFTKFSAYNIDKSNIYRYRCRSNLLFKLS